jgi:hypothetical protein
MKPKKNPEEVSGILRVDEISSMANEMKTIENKGRVTPPCDADNE